MAEATAIANKPAWIDLSSSDPSGSQAFYATLFGWDIQVSPDPQYGGYALAKLGGKDAAGIGPKQSPDAPTAWMLYIGTSDVEGVAKKVTAAGGNVIMAPLDVPEQGRMAVFQDPSGAFISAWEPKTMGGFQTHAPNSFGWAELNARGLEKDIAFYSQIFGWTHKTSDVPGSQPYTEFQLDGHSIAGGQEMNPMIPPNVPSYWLVYFDVADVDASFQRALQAGAREMVSPLDYPGGRFAILSDPQGAQFGLLKQSPQAPR